MLCCVSQRSHMTGTWESHESFMKDSWKSLERHMRLTRHWNATYMRLTLDSCATHVRVTRNSHDAHIRIEEDPNETDVRPTWDLYETYMQLSWHWRETHSNAKLLRVLMSLWRLCRKIPDWGITCCNLSLIEAATICRSISAYQKNKKFKMFFVISNIAVVWNVRPKFYQR